MAVETGNNITLTKEAQNYIKSQTDIKNAIVSIFDSTGIAGFIFNVPKIEQVRLSNEITDYYSDSNTYFNDHIAHKPVVVTVGGLQGEYFYSVNKLKDMISNIGTTLKLVQQFKPQFSAIQKQIRTKWNNYRKQVETIEQNQLANYDLYDTSTYGNLSWKQKANLFYNQFKTYDGVDLFKLFQTLYKFKSAQTRAYMFFETLSYANKPFTVETRWKRFENMYIQDIQVSGEETADITEFQVTFKQMNFANSQVVKINAAGRTQQQYWQVTNKGIDNGTKVETIKIKDDWADMRNSDPSDYMGW